MAPSVPLNLESLKAEVAKVVGKERLDMELKDTSRLIRTGKLSWHSPDASSIREHDLNSPDAPASTTSESKLPDDRVAAPKSKWEEDPGWS